jgi:uncharacterized cofD-like protein
MNKRRGRLASNLKWLYPGMHVKRWILIIVAGTVLLIFSMILFFLDWTVLITIKMFIQNLFAYLPIAPMADPWREIIALSILALSLFLIFFGGRKLVVSVLTAVLPEHAETLAEMVYAKRLRQKRLKVVAIGGGTGLATLLRGVKRLPVELTAIVTVSDDGGSSGKLRQELGILPPGDVRNCLVALSEAEPLMENLFQYRFAPDSSLGGHNFGNLFIAALTKTTGDFGKAVLGASQVLRVNGQVLPFTLDNVMLQADFVDGTQLSGETAIREAVKPIVRVRLVPEAIQPTPGILERITEADLILIGPGSLFTSLIPPFLQPNLAQAVRQARVPRIFVMNVMTEHGETDGCSAADHLEKLFQHAGGRVADYCLISNSPISEATLARYREESAEPVKIDLERVSTMGVKSLVVDLTAEGKTLRHDSAKLAQAIWAQALLSRRHR